MGRVQGRAGGGDLGLLRRLVTVTIFATLALIVVGGVVRVSDSGLGCGAAGSGLEGWPLCGGRALPLIQENAVIEFSHRLLAGVVGLLILAIVWQARKLPRSQTLLRRGSLLAGVLVLAQAGLGGLTVEHNLEDELVAAHLGLAMLLLATLIVLAWAVRRERPGAPRPLAGRGLRPLAVAASVLILATVVAGGYIAGTEEEGVRDGVANGAHLACGEEFPGCLDGVLPFGEHGRLVDIQLAHRALVYVTTATLLGLFGLALYRRVWSREFSTLALLLALQLMLGALNVWLGKDPGLILAHLTTGTLLWAAAVSATLRLSPAPAPLATRSPQPETSAAPA
ncbi:MAG: COX15/CtaA family protein [Actinomycetota bacterium]